MNDPLITAAQNYLLELFKDNADGHDARHSLRVYRLAMRLAEDWPECNQRLVALAALLHDADDHKLFHTENHANARRFLVLHQTAQEETEEICAIIGAVSFSRNRGRRPDTLEGKIVQDADRLDALGAVGIARTFAYGGSRGRSLDDSIRHFHKKLLLLKDEMNTPQARELAKARHALMETFLRAYAEETE